MRSRGRAGNRFPKSQKGNAIGTQVGQQRLSLRTIRMKRHVHGVVMIEPPSIVNSALSKNSNRQRFLKRAKKEALKLNSSEIMNCSNK